MINDTTKSILDIFKSFFWSINEKDISRDIPKKIKNKCFIKNNKCWCLVCQKQLLKLILKKKIIQVKKVKKL